MDIPWSNGPVVDVTNTNPSVQALFDLGNRGSGFVHGVPEEVLFDYLRNGVTKALERVVNEGRTYYKATVVTPDGISLTLFGDDLS